jgi:PAS domain S-box-containing protein
MKNTSTYNAVLLRRLRSLSLCIVGIMLLMHVVLLAGWIIYKNSTELPPLFANPACSILFFISGISFLFITTEKKMLHYAGYALAMCVLLSGVYSLFNGNELPQEIINSSAIGFILAGCFLLTLRSKTKKRRIPAQLFAALALLVGLFSMVGDMNGVDDFHDTFNRLLLSPINAFSIMALSICVFLAYADRGILTLFTGKAPGSISARRLIPAAVVIPVILGLVRMYGHWTNFFSVDLGASLFVLSTIVISVAIILYNAKLLNSSDSRREEISEELRYNNILLENISDAIISTDEKYYIKTWNEHAEKLYGWKAEEVIGKAIDQILKIEYPYMTSDEIIQQLFAKNNWSGEVIHQHKNKDKLNVYISGSLLQNDSGEYRGLVTVVRDITQSKKAIELVKESELRLQNIIDSYTDPIYAKDINGRFFIWNKACEKNSGLALEDVKGKTAQDIYPGEILNRTVEKDNEVFVTRAPVQYEEHIEYNDKVIDYSIILFPLINLKNELYGSGGVCVDITSSKQLEKNLQTFNEQLEKEVKERTEELRHLAAYLNNVREEERISISREIHDELGQQLTVLKMDISWLDKKLSLHDPEIKERITQVINFINDAVITVRRIASQLRPGVLSDLGLIAAIEWQLNELKKRTGIKIIFRYDEIPEQLPEAVNTGMFRILQECLTNVVRHADASQVIVEIKHDQHNHLLLKIQDDGKGFDKSRNAKKTLGLLGMQERAVVMGGKYSISSTPGSGTTIVVDVEV